MGAGERRHDAARKERVCPDGGLEPTQLLDLATEKEQADIIADVVGHPKGAPTVEELVYMNTVLDEETIRHRLSTLSEAGVLEEQRLDSEKADSESPSTFYEVTPAAREVFDKKGLFPVEAWQRQYDAVAKTDRVRALEQLHRSSR